MGFFDSLFKANAKKVKRSLMDMYVGFDPETASEIQIEELKSTMEKESLELAIVINDRNLKKKEVDSLKELYDKRLKAANILQAQLDSETDEIKKKNTEASLTKAINLIKETGGQLDPQQSMLDTLNETVRIKEDLFDKIKKKLSNIKSETENMRVQLDLSEQQRKLAVENKKIAEKAAGFSDDLDAGDSISSAMERKIKQNQAATEAARMQANALKVTDDEKDDPVLAAAIAEASGTTQPTNTKDLLESLKRK